MEDPINIPASAYENPPATASQLTLLLSAATAAADEEFKRSERLDRRALALATFAALVFVGVQILVAGLLVVLSDGGNRSDFVPFVAILAVASTAALVATLGFSYLAWRFRDESAPALTGISGSDYVGAAAVGNPRVGINLVMHYAEIATDRRRTNDGRVRALSSANVACFLSTACVAAETALAFVAVAVR